MSQPKKERDRPGTILIVDDEPNIREVLGSLLSEEGYRMDFAENGHAGYEKARELIPDLILMDITMPVMDGFDACRKIRTEPPLAQVPIIMITAVSDDESRIRSMQSGADDILSKPFDFDELLAKVKNITKDDHLRELPPEMESRLLTNEDLPNTCDATIEGWAGAPESREAEIEGDSGRDTEMTLRTARAAGVSEDET
jgi:putative two-component system response regulator